MPRRDDRCMILNLHHVLVPGLPDAGRVYFRVAALGTAGQGPYSDLASCKPG